MPAEHWRHDLRPQSGIVSCNSEVAEMMSQTVIPCTHPMAARHEQRSGDVRGGCSQHGISVGAPLQLVEVGPLPVGEHRLARLVIDLHPLGCLWRQHSSSMATHQTAAPGFREEAVFPSQTASAPAMSWTSPLPSSGKQAKEVDMFLCLRTGLQSARLTHLLAPRPVCKVVRNPLNPVLISR